MAAEEIGINYKSSQAAVPAMGPPFLFLCRPRLTGPKRWPSLAVFALSLAKPMGFQGIEKPIDRRFESRPGRFQLKHY